MFDDAHWKYKCTNFEWFQNVYDNMYFRKRVTALIHIEQY